MMRPSYFRPYMKPARDVNEFCRVIESQYVNATFTMCRVLENSMVEIYELESITSGGRVIFRRPGVKENALYGDAQPIESDNVLGDPGFETGTWQNLALSGNVSRSGETSGEFADKADVAMSEIVNLGDSTSITASLWAYSMIREGGRVKIALRYLDEDGRTISNNHPIADIRAPNEKWRQHTVSVSKNEFPPTATDVVIQIQRLKRPDAGEGGSVFIDDASLKVRLQ